MERILYIAHTQAEGELGKSALEGLTAAVEMARGDSSLSVAVIGQGADQAIQQLGGCNAERFLVADAAELAPSRYATDAAALTELVRVSGAEVIVAPGTARFSRVLPGVAQRSGGRIDTRVTGLTRTSNGIEVERWFYRQRMVARMSRTQRPWFILVAGGVFAPWSQAAETVEVERVAVDLASRTQVVGTETPAADTQTIRPDADMLLVAGAGWTKKQADGQIHSAEAEELILTFLDRHQASLGSSKSLVDQGTEGEPVLSFLSHLNQIGQTGASPRHARGLATCCHGEEPHVVGWRFIGERRAVNLDANCGWAQGKTDVLYVADAFAVMARINELLAAE